MMQWCVIVVVALTLFISMNAFQLRTPSNLVTKSSTWKWSLAASSSSVEATADVVVVGSGISGSTAAFYLHKQGMNVVMTEAKSEVGGNLISKKADGFLWEEGPNSFQPNPEILRLAKDIGLLDDLVLADPKLPRYVYWRGDLHALPSGINDVLSFNLLSCAGKMRAGIGAMGFVAPKPNHEETVEEFVTRHLGYEVFERVIDPFVSGVYAGDPRKLSMKAALKKVKALEDLGFTPGILDGAIVRISQLAAAKKEVAQRDADLPTIPGGSLGSFREGLQSIPLKISQILGEESVKLSHKLVKVEREDNQWVSFFEVSGDDSTEKCVHKIRSKVLLITAPAHITANLFRQSDPNLLPEACELEKVNYPPVASVTLAYPNEAFKKPLDGFGHLIPRAMKIRTLGTIWSSCLFPGRAPEGHSLLLSYIGGAQDPGIMKLSPEAIVQQVHEDNKKILLKENAPPPKVLGVRIWPKAIPQYELGHLDLLQRVEQGMKRNPGLLLGGNYRTGVAFGDCVQYGANVAKEIAQMLNNL